MDPVSAEKLERLSSLAYLPADYLAWLREKGYGEIGNCRYMIYGGPIRLDEIQAGAPKELWAFGDDFAGYCGCFSEQGGQGVIEWDSASWEANQTGLSFVEFVGRFGTPR